MSRKVHRAALTRSGSEAITKWRRNRAACSRYKVDGVPINTKRDPDQVLNSAQFVWVPNRFQCRRCLLDWKMPYGSALTPKLPLSATPEMQTTVEAFILGIHRIGQTEHEHRCWLEQEIKRVHAEGFGNVGHDRTVCACGKHSWLDTRSEFNTLRITRSGKVYLKGQRPKRKVAKRAPVARLTDKQMAKIVNRMIDAAMRAQ
jgi:hypothetical protein